ncbi:MAG: C-GCAxxG-C-C family protein [Erysipelotrichaceae bacterium]|nr:C-GCAxxG-C-C family protein [Erysipelotrichaceae bacterium]
MSFKDCVRKYYIDENYNCSECLIHAANEYYGLNIDAEDMKMFGGFGSGMYSGIVCGTLIANTAILSKMVIENKAREESRKILPVINGMVRDFEDKLKGNSCRELRPMYYTKEESCLKTVLLAAEVLEKAVAELKEKGGN